MLGLDNNLALIERAMEGSVSAWERLVKRHERLVFNHALRMTGNHDDALDLMQEVFMGVYSNLHQFKQDGNFKSWLLKITSNRCIDFFRRRKPDHDADEEPLATIASDQTTPEDAFFKSTQNQLVMHVLTQLNPDQRMVIELKFFQNLTFEEIATLTAISTNTIKSRFYAALRNLKSLLEVHHVAS
ncbi:MAG: sigma-70 family RNA polymerase sigma factor [Acidobacteria bacterium]|nr:sigma-70 family RNA polymerase sigma factor [Acidobacteriota bacterium]